jgi:hypothetical protein
MRKLIVTASGIAGLLLVGACATSVVDDDPVPADGTSSGGGSSGISSGSSGAKKDAGPSSSSGGSGMSSGSSGTSSSSGGSGMSSGGMDAGTDSGPVVTNPTLSVVKTGAVLLGVTTGANPHIVSRTATTLEAVPVSGGTAVTLSAALTADDFAAVNGGVVAWFPGTNAATGIAPAALIWTAANGVKTITSPTRGLLFAGSNDGSRVSMDINAASTNLSTGQVAITSTAAPSAVPVLTDLNAVNLQASFATPAGETEPPCAPAMQFAGTTFVGAYCAGTDGFAQIARIVTFAVGDVAANVRATEAANLIPFAAADDTGTKIAVAGVVGTVLEARILSGATSTVVESGISGTLNMARDGSVVFYGTTIGGLKRATVAAAPVITTIAANATKYISLSEDGKKFAFATQENGALTDVKTVDPTAAAPVVATIVTGATSFAPRFTGDGSRIVYVDNVSTTTGLGTLKSKPFAGGTEVVLAASAFNSAPAQTGTSILIGTSIAPIGASTTDSAANFDYIDALVGGTAKAGAMNVFVTTSPTTGGNPVWSGKTFVFESTGAAPGVSKLVVP